MRSFTSIIVFGPGTQSHPRPHGTFPLISNQELRDGTYWDIAYPADAQTRRIIEQAILAEYEKIVAESEQQKANANSK